MVNTTGIKCITLSIDDTPETEYKVFAHYKIENSLLTLKKVLHADGCKIYPETIIDDNPQHDLARHQIEAIIEEITKEEGL